MTAIQPGAIVKVISDSRYYRHLDKVDFTVTRVLPDGRAEAVAMDHPAITRLHDHSVGYASNIKIPKNTLSGVAYVFDITALAPADIWQMTRDMQAKGDRKVSPREAIEEIEKNQDGEGPVKVTSKKSGLPEKMHPIKRAFCKTNVFQAIRDIQGRNLAYDGQYVTDGYVLVGRTPQFIPNKTDIEKCDLSRLVSCEIREPIDGQLSAIVDIEFDRKTVSCYASVIDDCLLTFRRAHIDLFRHYFPGCTFRIDRQSIVGDRFRDRLHVYDDAGEWLGLIMPSLPDPRQIATIKEMI